MNPIPIQIGMTMAFGFAIARNLGSIHSNRIGWQRSILWVLLWSAGLVVIWFPGLTTYAAHLVGIGRGVDAALYVSIALLSYVVFCLYAALEKQDCVITRLVSELALAENERHTEGTVKTLEKGR